MVDEPFQKDVVGVLAAGSVPVPAQEAGLGEKLSGDGFHLLGAKAEELDALAPAIGADQGHSTAPVAMMADQFLLGPMIGQGHIAAGALEDVATVTAHDESGCAPPIEKEDDLLASGQRFGHGPLQSPAKDAAVASAQFLPQVNNLDRG